MKAISRYGRASRLRDAGKNEEALRVGREVLAILRKPVIVRTNPAEASVLLCCTLLVEELADKLQKPGAEKTDILDSLAHLKLFPEGHNVDDLREWISFLEWKAQNYEASQIQE